LCHRRLGARTKAAESVNEITHAAASSAQEMSSASEQLSRMAQRLQGMMGRFNTGDRDELPAGVAGTGETGVA
jgi:hypothetical protein